jgi:hypothetical protein
MKHFFSRCSSFLLLAFINASPLCAQTATVIESKTSKQSYIFSNASGFSIANNGPIVYGGPINQLTGSPCCTSATITVNGVSTTITPSVFEADTGISPDTNGGNTLSPRLSEAVIPTQNGVDQIIVEYAVIVGGVTRIGVSDSYTLQEKVDGQSLSIFPQFQPSVFP